MKRFGVALSSWLLALALIGPMPAGAQEITQTHLRAAWEAIRALGVDDEFDNALPDLAVQVQTVLVQRRPDLANQITTTVNQVALNLVATRRALNDQAARIWALVFTEEELGVIVQFYNSEVGRKLAQIYPDVLGETVDAFQIWYQATAEQLLEQSVAALEQQGYAF